MMFDEMELEVKKIEEENQLFDHEFGFGRIVEMMIEAKIPLIGHNCMYDICYFY